ncbi:MAG: hypothetical protein ACREV5_21400 [Steroidobacter sp.]
MRFIAASLIFIAVLGCAMASAAERVQNSERIAELLAQDQMDRKGFPNTALSWKEINVRDEARREEILSMLKEGKVRTGQDYYYSAVIFHHGQTDDHYRLAASLAWIAATIEPENKDYLWQTASTWDRFMVKRGRPQWYGIQPKINDEGEVEGRYQIDEGAVTDEERARYQVRPLAEIRELKNGSARVDP